MKNIKNIIFGIGNTINNTYIHWTRQKIEINKEWFEKIYNKHFTEDVKAKFNSELFVDQSDLGNELLQFVKKAEKERNHLLNSLRVLKDWIIEFNQNYEELKAFLSAENITIDLESRQAIQLELLKSQSNDIEEAIEKFTTILEPINFSELESLNRLSNSGLELARSFDFRKIAEYETEDTFIQQQPQTEEGKFACTLVFRKLSEIVAQIQEVNLLIDKIKERIIFVEGNAGMGKSNLSAYLSTEFIQKDYPVIFIKARSFSGDPDQFEQILMRELEIPAHYHLSEVLTKLNTYGKTQQKRVTIIIDGLNETSFGVNGFSPIWQRNLDQFLSEFKAYTNLFFIATLRTSYVDRIWVSDEIPYQSYRLNGFDSNQLLKVTELYFNHYEIAFSSPNSADIFYFRTPLLLDLYCRMLNPDKIKEKEPVFGLEGFVSVFENYIQSLAQKIKTQKGLSSTNKVTNGLNNSSIEMLSFMGAYLPIEKYYLSIDDKDVVKTEDSDIAHPLLEEYLIFLKNSIEGNDVVEHTQQEVGGFLLAKALLKQFNNDLKQLIKGDFFVNHMLKEAAEQHQLANDIMKFLIVLSEEYTFLIKKFSDEPSVQDYLWIKLQREPKSEQNNELRNLLSEQILTSTDINKLLKDSRPSIINPNSTLNFLNTKSHYCPIKLFKSGISYKGFPALM